MSSAKMADMTIEPDLKDWTWVLERPCTECGFSPDVDVRAVPARVRDMVPLWADVLARSDATTRPDPATWSPTEYACHVRDVCTLFSERIDLMLAQDDPVFANWNQDETAVEQRYDQQQPSVVAAELATAAELIASTIESVPAWERTGRRSDGSAFTVETLVIYFIHDLEHHLADVSLPQ